MKSALVKLASVMLLMMSVSPAPKLKTTCAPDCTANALADGHFRLAAGALDRRPDAGREYAMRLGVAADRAYGDWKEMLAGERNRPDRVDLVTVATPNASHFEITKAFLEAGFNVLCEKPMTMTVEEGEEIVRVAATSGKICAWMDARPPMFR